MSRCTDVTELIAEQAADHAERLALEATACRLARGLESPVPYRPEFKAELRRELTRAARRQLLPWYRRTAFLGSGMAVAAAAAVLVIGLNLWQRPSVQEVAPDQVAQEPTEGVQSAPEAPPAAVQEPSSFLVALPADLPAVSLADERRAGVEAAGGMETTAAEAPAGGLELKQLTARPGEADFRAMANRLAFRGESRRTTQGWAVSDADRSLTMTVDGTVQYADLAEAPAVAEPVDAKAADQAARRFLDQALLPVHSQPAITEQEEGYKVVYTEKVDGRPVVNARTEIEVNAAGEVTWAKAYVASGVTTHATYTAVVAQEEALALATERGGEFDRADLVWVRSVGEGTVYLQPAWRVYGVDSQGERVVRYVPALKR